LESNDKFTLQMVLPRRQVIVAMGGTMLAMLIGSLYMTIIGVAMPRVITDLGGFSQYSLVFSSFFIAEVVVIPIAGKLSDLYGRKWFYIIGLIVFVIGSFLCGISETMMQLVIFRGLQGLGFGFVMPLSLIVVGDLFPPAERGKYQGLMAGVMGVSSILGPVIGGYLTDSLSWRWCFFIFIPLGLLVIFLFFFFFPQLQADRLKHRIDYSGVTTIVLAVVPLILALNWGGTDYEWVSPTIIGMLSSSVLMFTLFCFNESRAEEPIVSLGLFRNRVVAVSSAVSFLHGLSFFAVVAYLPLYFQGVMGVSATESGGIMIPMMLGSVVTNIACGQIISRTGGYYRLLSTIGFTIIALGFYLLSGITMETSPTSATLYVLVVGIGLGFIIPVHTLAVQNTVPYSVMGSATSMITWLRTAGGLFGLAIVGSVINNRFFFRFISDLPSGVKAVVSVEKLMSIVDNPQALVSVAAQDQLRVLFEGFGTQGPALLEQLIYTLRNALNSALAVVFITVLGINILTLIVNLFLKGIPSHKIMSGEKPIESRG
jgi:EmrB/QacA subfamily drug resistance transporter